MANMPLRFVGKKIVTACILASQKLSRNQTLIKFLELFTFSYIYQLYFIVTKRLLVLSSTVIEENRVFCIFIFKKIYMLLMAIIPVQIHMANMIEPTLYHHELQPTIILRSIDT